MKTIGLTFPVVKEDTFPCPRCGKPHKTTEAVEKHMKDKHPEQE